MLSWLGKILEPVGSIIGLNWKMMVALLSSIIAKENAVASLSVLYNAGEEGLMNVLPDVISHSSAISFLIILMLFIPCMPTITVMRQELGNWRWFFASFFNMLFASFLLSFLAYRLAIFLGI